MAGAKIARRATKKLETEERRLVKEVYKAKSRLEALRRKVPPRPVEDYAFTGWTGKPLLLSKAFGKKPDLIVIHNMGSQCPMCTTWADGFNGVIDHLEDRAAFLLVSPEPVATQRAFAKQRGWRFPMASSAGTTFFADMGYEDDQGRPWPGVTTFHRDESGDLWRVASTGFGPGDDFSPAFSLIFLLKGGQGEWWPRLSYPRRRAR
jgi:predicted dithiol-disulfide oxidoreductase (DUF899 family)